MFITKKSCFTFIKDTLYSFVIKDPFFTVEPLNIKAFSSISKLKMNYPKEFSEAYKREIAPGVKINYVRIPVWDNLEQTDNFIVVEFENELVKQIVYWVDI